MTDMRPSSRDLGRKVIRYAVVAILVLGSVLFIPAGTLRYWQAWVYLSVLLISMVFAFRYLLLNSPELLLASPVADQGVCYNYFGGANSDVNGTFTVVWHANGLFRITV